MDVETAKHYLDFDVAKSLRYHAYRRAFWDSVDSVSKILTIMSGTAVLVTLVGDATRWSEALAVVVALASASDVVLGFSSKARDHDGLYRAFSRLAQDITDDEQTTQETIRSWRRRRLEIEMDEPFIMDLLERRCAGEEARARGLKVDSAWNLSPFETFISQIAFWPATHREPLA